MASNLVTDTPGNEEKEEQKAPRVSRQDTIQLVHAARNLDAHAAAIIRACGGLKSLLLAVLDENVSLNESQLQSLHQIIALEATNHDDNVNGSGNPAKELFAGMVDFQRAASDIVRYNKEPSSVFNALRSVAKRLLKDKVQYRTLDTENPRVREVLIRYEGVLDFLQLLGFESDAMVCNYLYSEKLESVKIAMDRARS